MTNQNIYENLPFKSINTIIPEDFPSQFPLHWHKHIELLHLLPSATTEISIWNNQQKYTLYPGDICFIWPGELHEISDNREYQLVGLQFPTHLIQEQEDFAGNYQKLHHLHVLSAMKYPVQLSSIAAYIAQMLSLKTKHDDFLQTHTLINFYQMFLYICQHQEDFAEHKKEVSSFLAGKNQQIIADACNYITEHCSQPLTLNDISAYCGFSTCYFSRLFKKITSYHFIEYVTLQRIEYAQTLLTDYNNSVTDVCYLAGFKSLSAFHRSFRKIKKCSPSEYRNYYATL